MRPETYFAPSERATAADLNAALATLSANPLVDTLLDTVSGLMAVLNQQRQILAVNQSLFRWLDLDNPDAVLGLRPGEALGCLHADAGPGGCGTGPTCAACGAVIAILACQASGQAEERDCVATVERHGQLVDLYFQVRCSPFEFQGHHLLLLFLRDTTHEQQRRALERTFYHDINNLIGALFMNSQLLETLPGPPMQERIAHRLVQVSNQLAHEVEIQRALAGTPARPYPLQLETLSLAQLLPELQAAVQPHPAAQGKTIIWPEPDPAVQLCTDATLLLRILVNMLLNALEASDPGDQVKFWIEPLDPVVRFSVWNRRAIPAHVAPRIFQRNFSTKPGPGHGLGTYSMRFFGETYLKGQVRFETAEGQGTVFSLDLPLRLPPAGEPEAVGSAAETLVEQTVARR